MVYIYNQHSLSIKGVKMFERIVFFVFGLGFLVAGFMMYVLVFNPTSLGVQNALPLPMTIFFSFLGIFYVLEGIRIIYDGIRDW